MSANYIDYNKEIYGALYSWWVVDPANPKKVAPTGWHVATDAEWTALTDHLGGLNVAARKIKETGTVFWKSPNIAATNESGFSAGSGGNRLNTGGLANFASEGYWWCAGRYDTSNGWSRFLQYGNAVARRARTLIPNGFSIRCVKD